jgi:RHS repeat-associated protein
VWKYYYAGAQRIAMRTVTNTDNIVNWIIGDHLGSTSVAANLDGTLPTDYTYTGQYSHTGDFGLMFYNARWYDPALGRMAQADSIIPGAGNPMAFDRYAYALNSPVGNVDPSEHRTCTAQQAATGDETCHQNSYNNIETNDVPLSEDVPLTDWGKVIAQRFSDMQNTPGWWNDYDGDGEIDYTLTLEEFVGLWIITEAANNDDWAQYITQTISQRLYVGAGTPGTYGYQPPTCTSTACKNGLFNFMGSESHGDDSLFTFPLAEYPGPGSKGLEDPVGLMESAAAFGTAALHPASLIWDRNDSPAHWGNNDSFAAALDAGKVEPGYYGTDPAKIYFYFSPNFVVFTMNQAAHWGQ